MPTELINTSLFNDANLKGYWRLESNGNDSGSNGYTLTGTNRGYVAGKFGNGADFETSSSDFITNTSPSNCLVSGSQTWSCWVKAESTGAGGVFRIFGRMLASSPFNGVAILRAPSTDFIGFQCYGLTTNTVVYSGTELDVGNWQHLVGVYDSANSKLKIFVNGVKTEVTASGSVSTSGSESLSIGRSGAYDADYFDGIVDDAVMFNRALSDAEVEKLYSGDFSASPSVSPSASPSTTPSTSPSATPSSSPSLSGSPSPSLSPSSSQSPSSSESRSISLSPSVSVSASFSPSPSVSVSSSISPSQPPGSGLYSKQSSASLPSTKNDLNIIYGEEDETDVSTDNGVRVSIEGDNNYLIHQYKVVNTNSTDSIRVKINLQSSLAPTTSPVYLQVWKVSSSQWETIDTDSTSPVNTDFDLTALIDSNQENYYDTDYEVAFRVYQLRV